MKRPDTGSCYVHAEKKNRSGQDKRNRLSIWALWIKAAVPIFTFLVASSASGQTYFFDNYGVADGLSQSTVYKIIQDRMHNLWLGTQSGVSVFDGMAFQNYSTEDGLAINGVRAICETPDGAVWLGHTGGGISRYVDGKFRQITLPGVTPASDITSIFEDGKGNLWILTAGDGAIKLTGYTSRESDWKVIQFKGNELSDQVFGGSVGKDRTVYLVTDIGIKRFSDSLNRFTTYQPEGLTTYFTRTCILEDSRGDFWFGTYHGGLYRLVKKEGKFKVYDIRDGLSSNWISTLHEDPAGRIWVGTWGGGITVIEGDSLMVYNTGNGLQDDKIWCFLNDAEGNLLIGTNEQGLSIHKGNAFITFGTRDGLHNPQVWAITKDSRGYYWFGTSGGITRLKAGARGSVQTSYLDEKSHFLNNQVRFLQKDSKGNIWIGTNGGGIYFYQINTERLVFDPILNSLLYKDLVITALVIDRKDQLWAGTNEGLVYYEIANQKGDRLTRINGLAGNEISSLFYDSRGILWIGARGKGLTRYDDNRQQFTVLRSLENLTPRCMAEDAEHRLWIGMEGQGVYVLEADSIVLHLSEKEGLLSNLVNLLGVDNSGNIYIGTNKGLNKFLPGEGRMLTYTRRNGFTGIETKSNAFYFDPAGYIWFGTVNGAVRYSPGSAGSVKREPLTHIRRFRVNYTDYPLTSGIHLPWYNNSVIFDYNSVSLTNPDVVTYQIMLQGNDRDWQPPTRQTTASYSALSPGKYVFLVKARNAEGIWNSQPVAFSFQILPPFWKRWWFILLCIAAGSTSIVAYIKVRERNLLYEKRLLEEKVLERTQEITRKNQELASKNKDITDSIRYAERIQRAMLPPDVPFPETFVLFRPKAIVSGDFYWFMEEEGLQLMAAIDCTGHGVPGAFMSIIGYHTLNKIVREDRILDPALILKNLNITVHNALRQKGDTSPISDGMDMSLAVYDPVKRILTFAGAVNPILLIRNHEITELKGDRYPIGHVTPADTVFTNHELPLQKGDMIYLFSDGYADQFGGPYGKKFKPLHLKELLLKIHDKSPEEQRVLLNQTLEDWMKGFEQNDDILIIGRRF